MGNQLQVRISSRVWLGRERVWLGRDAMWLGRDPMWLGRATFWLISCHPKIALLTDLPTNLLIDTLPYRLAENANLNFSCDAY